MIPFTAEIPFSEDVKVKVAELQGDFIDPGDVVPESLDPVVEPGHTIRCAPFRIGVGEPMVLELPPGVTINHVVAIERVNDSTVEVWYWSVEPEEEG